MKEPELFMKALTGCLRRAPAAFLILTVCRLCQPLALANPAGASVAQGTASIHNSGSQTTIQTSDRAYIIWQTFNIGVGETTTFLQPSSSSVVWNQINDPNPSQILGNLNANGYVVLQNQSGFYIGGQASITAHGLIMTTAPIPIPDLAGGGAWQFNAPPPTASIINYGQINLGAGGSLFLIAHDIQNSGAISAPQGNIGLYAGQQVLVSERPDGRGLSAKVTLPQGSVDNAGNVIADAGTIAMQAQVVNQGGVVQANSVQTVNGVIELLASDSLNLGASSVISAKGDSASSASSPGGFVVLKSGNSFADTAGSAITVSGASGGQNGIVEIFGNGVDASTIQSSIGNTYALLINPFDITLGNAKDLSSPSSPQLRAADLSPNYTKIALFADDNILLQTAWTLYANPDPMGALNLEAGNNIIFNNGSGIKAVLSTSSSGSSTAAQNNWGVNLTAGTQLPADSKPDPTQGTVINGVNRLDGIYLDGNSYIQLLSGSADLWAANELIVDPGTGLFSAGNNGIRTLKGGSINVTAEYGDVNTGANYNGYLFAQKAAPYYKVNAANLGGISTAAGGDVTISAGGDVTSFLPRQNNWNQAQYDGGTGAFGPQPGNVTITAGGNVSGHYVLANGVGTITAGGDIGSPITSGGFALSLIDGSWSVYAPHGSIYLQDARNPNGVFNVGAGNVGSTVASYAGYHRFDYSPLSSVLLDAGNSVEITGAGAPHQSPADSDPVPLLFPPTLQVIAGGSGGFVLDTDVILFPSAWGNLHITTLNGGDFQSSQGNNFSLEMSDSGSKQWDPNPPASGFGSFGISDHAATPPELNNPDPVEISIAGSMNNVTIYVTKEAQVTVGGDMFNSSLIGENLHASDVTSINVAGKIYYPPIYAFAPLTAPIVGVKGLAVLNPTWDSIFYLLVDPAKTASFEVPANASTTLLMSYADSLRLILSNSGNPNPGFIYDPSTHQLGFQFQMSSTIRDALEGPLEIIKVDQFGNPVIQRGQANLGQDPNKYYFATTTVSFVPPSVIQSLYDRSQASAKSKNDLSPGLQIGGPGQFNISAASIDLGSSLGILSWGIGNATTVGAGLNYASLAPLTESGAAINVNVAGDLNMLTSTIASIDGGDVTVNSRQGGVYLSLGDFSLIPPNAGNICYGIFTSGHSDVKVTADKDINVGGARIAAFNGGDVFVESSDGDVNAGNGANSTLTVPVIYLDPTTHLPISGTIGDGSKDNPRPYGSGILAISPTTEYQTPGGNPLPGNITVVTPRGDIVSTLGGIQQFALNGSIAGGPTITLTAGTPASGGSPGYPGNIDLGAGGVIGGTLNLTAQGNIQGLIVSRQSTTIDAAGNFSGTLLSAGNANISAGGTVSGTIVGIGGISANVGTMEATLLSQNVSVGGGQAQSTLGTSATATATSQSAAQQASNDTKQQVALDNTLEDDDIKKKGKHPALTRRTGRVTVILPKTM
jgi:filamentous hemagglutinin family protein